MSSPLNATLLAALRSYQAQPVTLAKIELTVPSARTLYFGTTEVITTGDVLWRAGLSADPLHATIDYLGPGPNPPDATLRLISPDVPALLSDYLWQNALVTLYLWEQSCTAIAPGQVFQGKVSRPDVDVAGLTLYLIQDESENVIIPPTVIDKTNYPNAPDGQQGVPIPIVYGDHSDNPMRSPWATPYGKKADHEDSGAGAGVVPMLLVDPGVGNAKAKVVAASHLCSDLLDRANGLTQYIVAGATPAPLDTAGLTETLGASESFIEIADEGLIAYAAIIPIDVRVAGAGSTATNPRRAMDVIDETSFASMDQATASGVLQFVLPNGGSLGHIESVEVIVAFKGNAANGNNIRVGPYQPGVGYLSSVNKVSTGVAPEIWRSTWPTGAYSQNWDFGGGATTYDVRVDFVAGAANKASVYWVALIVKYRPQLSLVTPGYFNVPFLGFTVPLNTPYTGPFAGGGPYPNLSIVQPQFRLEGQFYGNLKGYKDDGGGTFTGTGSALIQRPPDIVQHLLATYGLVAGANIETNVGGFGSFVDARDTLRNAQPSDLELACWIGQLSSVKQALQAMCQQSGMAVYLDRFTNLWRCHVWKLGSPVDYDRTLAWEDLDSLSLEETSTVDVASEVRVRYGYDHLRGRTAFEAFVGPNGSSRGFVQPTVRDQQILVTAGVNDKLDWNDGISNFTDTLTAGSYEPVGFVSMVRALMRTHGLAGAVNLAHGFTVKTGFNDKIDLKVGATTYAGLTLLPGTYSADSLALAVAGILNGAGSGLTFTCAYSQATNVFTIAASGVFSLLSQTGANNLTCILPCMGFGYLGLGNPIVDLTGAATYTAAQATYADRLYLNTCGNSTQPLLTFKFLTGANTAKNPSTIMGFDVADYATSHGQLLSLYSRGSRELTAASNQTNYGPKPARVLTADWIRDETTAVELRNRIFDMSSKPRALVRFRTTRCPDLRRMQAIQFSSDLDAHVPFISYGSDGSWAGKVFRVLEVMQYLGPQYHQEIVAIAA